MLTDLGKLCYDKVNHLWRRLTPSDEARSKYPSAQLCCLVPAADTQGMTSVELSVYRRFWHLLLRIVCYRLAIAR